MKAPPPPPTPVLSASPGSPPAPSAAPARGTPPETGAIWARAHELVGSSSGAAAFLEHLELKSLASGVATVGLRDPGFRAIAEGRVEWLEGLLSRASGGAVRVKLDDGGGGDRPASDPTAGETFALSDKDLPPLVHKAQEWFRARITKIEERRG
ncbi:MAG: hypothetical protein IBJ11_10060 [Phycisphaerales bacterium]|nr:hypothetical protein [Phycisphaerales bacterium]